MARRGGMVEEEVEVERKGLDFWLRGEMGSAVLGE
jgi:hypothetical protein